MLLSDFLDEYGGYDPAVEEFLSHHGVKGMHWGVRKDPEPDEHRVYRKTALKEFNKNSSDAAIRRINRTFGEGISKEDYDRLSTKEVRYQKGKTFKRVTKDAEIDKNKNALYVSTNRKDATTYRAILPYENARIKSLLTPGHKKYGGFQESTYKATKALVGPSEKERVDAFIHLMDTKSITLKNGKTITGREYLKRTGLGHDVRRLDSQRLGLKYYHQFLATQYNGNSINSAYFRTLSEKGYDFVTDDNDRNIITKDPIIILDQAGNVKQMSVRQLKTDDVINALGGYKDLNTR